MGKIEEQGEMQINNEWRGGMRSRKWERQRGRKGGKISRSGEDRRARSKAKRQEGRENEE